MASKTSGSNVSSIEEHAEQARKLHSLGLTDYESRSLLTLIQHNPATAYEVAKNAGLPRANIYAALESLTKKNAVQPISENPVRYVPVDPVKFLNRIATQTSDLCRQLSESMVAIARPPSVEYVWSLSSLEEVRDKIRDLIAEAEKHVWMKGDISHIRDCVDSLESAAQRGVSIVIILFGTEEEKKSLEKSRNVKVYLHEGSGTPVGMSSHLISMTSDFRSALTANFDTGGYGVYTQNIPVVALVESLIRHEIYMAEIFRFFGPQIEEKFGVLLTTLRKKFLPSDQFHSLTLNLKNDVADKEGGS